MIYTRSKSATTRDERTKGAHLDRVAMNRVALSSVAVDGLEGLREGTGRQWRGRIRVGASHIPDVEGEGKWSSLRTGQARTREGVRGREMRRGGDGGGWSGRGVEEERR